MVFKERKDPGRDELDNGINMWSPVVISGDDEVGGVVGSNVPVSRCKHAAALHDQHLYLLGGRNGNLALKDFWRYHIGENKWEVIKGGGSPPGCLQDHSMVPYNNNLYVFGGEISFSNAAETPLWIFNIQEGQWRKYQCPKGVKTPKGRRSHTAIVFQDSMYIYGGYQDLKGSSSDLWAFHFPSETWHLVSQGGTVDGPPPRHKHSAVLHDSAMWVYGGMTDLQERSDCWKFDFISRVWRPVRSKPGPGLLHSHTAVKYLNAMLLFGGEREGQIINELWKFHFATEYWEKLVISSPVKPQPRAQSSAFVFSQFRCSGEVRYLGRPEQDYFGTPNTPSLARPLRNMAAKIREEAGAVLEAGRQEGKKYSFLPADSCAEDDDEDEDDAGVGEHRYGALRQKSTDEDILSIGRDLYRDIRRSQQFQRLHDGAVQKQNPILKPLAKVSNINLSRLSQYCSYSMFSNESTESLAESGSATPNSLRLSISTQRLHKSDEMNDPLPRDPLSVPNFASLNLDELNDPSCYYVSTTVGRTERGDTGSSGQDGGDASVLSPSGATRSDSQFTFQSYDCSSRSSTLPSSHHPVRLIDLEETGGEETEAELEEDEEDSSFVSGYESCEAVNLSFANPNYMGPDITSLIDRKEDDLHSSFAKALMSPTTEDTPSRCQVELRTRPRSMLVSKPADASSSAAHPPENGGNRVRPLSNIETSVSSSTGGDSQRVVREEMAKMERRLNAAAGPGSANRVHPEGADEAGGGELLLLMYVVGGREVGQVTVFRRPLSVWKLDLTRL